MHYSIEHVKKILYKYKLILDECFYSPFIAGSVYRNKKNVHDIDLIAKSFKDQKLFYNIFGISIVRKNKYFVSLKIKLDGVPLNILLCKKHNYYIMTKFLLKGPASFVIYLINLAEKKGYWLTHLGFVEKTSNAPSKAIETLLVKDKTKKRVISFKTEKQIIQFLDLKKHRKEFI